MIDIQEAENIHKIVDLYPSPIEKAAALFDKGMVVGEYKMIR